MIGDALLPYYDRGWRKSWGNFSHPFYCYIRADVEPKILNWLIDRGLTACAFGVESGDEEYRNKILHKQLNDKDLFRTMDILTKRNVTAIPFFMRHSPGETLEIELATHKMSKLLGPHPILFEYEELGASARWE